MLCKDVKKLLGEKFLYIPFLHIGYIPEENVMKLYYGYKLN